MREFKQKIATNLNMLVHTKTIDDETFLAIFKIVSTDFNDWRDKFVEELREEAHNWEETDESGLYSLALRRVIDKLTEKNFEDELPVLEKDTTKTEDEFLADVIRLRDEGDEDGKIR